jgi:hypothetical protein
MAPEEKITELREAAAITIIEDGRAGVMREAGCIGIIETVVEEGKSTAEVGVETTIATVIIIINLMFVESTDHRSKGGNYSNSYKPLHESDYYSKNRNHHSSKHYKEV